MSITTTRLSVLMDTPVMCDRGSLASFSQIDIHITTEDRYHITTEDRYWIEQEDTNPLALSNIYLRKRGLGLFPFLPKNRSSVKDLAEVLQDILVLSREL